MWTVVEKLPPDCLRKEERDVEIIDRHKFDPRDIGNTWHLPTLRHRKLARLVRSLESFRLGKTSDILLCMIPALSSRDLLPNDQFLKLVPEIGSDRGWLEIARYHKELLGTRMITRTKERFSFAVAVRAIDFLHLAFEPYLDITELGKDLREELAHIGTELVYGKLGEVVEILAPVYELQRRPLKKLEDFKCLSLTRADAVGQSRQPSQPTKHFMNHSAFKQHHKALGFTRLHRAVFNKLSNDAPSKRLDHSKDIHR